MTTASASTGLDQHLVAMPSVALHELQYQTAKFIRLANNVMRPPRRDLPPHLAYKDALDIARDQTRRLVNHIADYAQLHWEEMHGFYTDAEDTTLIVETSPAQQLVARVETEIFGEWSEHQALINFVYAVIGMLQFKGDDTYIATRRYHEQDRDRTPRQHRRPEH